MAENLDPVWMIMFIVRIVFAVAIVFFMSILILSLSISLDDDQLKRFSHELSESILSSELAESRGIISEAKLDSFIANSSNLISNVYPNMGSEISFMLGHIQFGQYPNIEPVFSRHCLIGYSASIRELNNDRFWDFGYRPSGLEEYGLAEKNFKSS